MSPWRRVGATAALAGGALLLGVAQASSASAHAQIVSSNPADGTNLAASPRTVTLVMSEAVELQFTHLNITDGQGHRTALTGLRMTQPDGDAAPAVAGATPEGEEGEEGESPVAITADLPALSPDLYRLAWSTLSSDDLHTTSGVVVFGVQRPVVARAPAPSDPLPNAAEVALRWAGLIGMGAATGGAVMWLMLLRSGRRLQDLPSRTARPVVARRLLAVVGVGAATSAVADLCMLLLQAHATGSGWFDPAVHLLGGSYGWRWSGREAAAMGVVVLVWRALRHARTPARAVGLGIVALGAGYAVAVTLTGHAGAGAGRHPVRIVIETVHVTSAITWVGALVVSALVLWRPVPVRTGSAEVLGRPVLGALRRALLARFGIVAATSLALMVTTGVLLAGSGVASLDALVMSTYGRLLLVKLGLTALALSAAATTALKVHPDLVPLRALRVLSRLRLRVVVAVEAAAAATVLLGAAALGSAQPAVGATWVARVPVPQLVSGTAQDLVETVQVAPNRPGRNFVTLDVFDTRRPVPAPIGSVQVRLTGPGGQSETAVASPQGAGRWLVPTDALTAPGPWSVDVSVSRAGLPMVSQRYPWVVTDPTVAPRRVVLSDRSLAPVLNRIAAGLAGGSVLVALLLVAQSRGSRKRTSAPPSGASPALVSPPNVDDTAATSASPSPVPGSSPSGWR